MKKALRVLAPLGLLAGIGAAHAEVPAAVATTLSTIGSDGVTVATTIVVAVFTLFAVKFLLKAK